MIFSLHSWEEVHHGDLLTKTKDDIEQVWGFLTFVAGTENIASQKKSILAA